MTSNGRTRIAAKKIDNIDLDALSLQEDTNSWKNELMAPSSINSIESTSIGAPSQTEIKEEDSGRQVQITPEKKEMSDDERLKMFKNAKSISSSSFRDSSDTPKADVQRFSGATAISSSQYFGNQSQKESKIDVQQSKLFFNRQVFNVFISCGKCKRILE